MLVTWLVEDLLDDSNNTNTKDEFIRRALIPSDILMINSIMKSLPGNWKKDVQNLEGNSIDTGVLLKNEIMTFETISYKVIKEILC